MSSQCQQITHCVLPQPITEKHKVRTFSLKNQNQLATEIATGMIVNRFRLEFNKGEQML